MSSSGIAKAIRPEWEKNYKEVLDFAKKNGHVNLSFKDKETNRLAQWLSRQKKRKQMSNYERNKLDVLKQYGYQEKKDVDATWNMFFNKLVDYKNDTGLFIVSTKDDGNKKLRKWIEKQRFKERGGTLLPETLFFDPLA